MVPKVSYLGHPRRSPDVSGWVAVILKTVRPVRVCVVRTLVARLTSRHIQVSHPNDSSACVYPRPRVLYLHSPIPYEALRVICCGGAGSRPRQVRVSTPYLPVNETVLALPAAANLMRLHWVRNLPSVLQSVLDAFKVLRPPDVYLTTVGEQLRNA